ncbi:hypothetical protein A3D66_01600 [Candidatus Kaiserbacteria bacterium RIFCSPHIGHO2_02_FULL_50_9]|uniref:Uncharacterized protein n=1 Tax=Candidatus Kaiserbacteria bacterium RIFCSPLOWO2_01_FULL_51_21 TaxID=1798508 RepID=A0A1F6ED81_9BACT|nr:MAG: hypothetical protein A2761_02290 [Candidatus Kaiserbacteria bacterium RIFCSPHIGHO2_01_FULL_51_33]OGG63787.1 MAG: hypothetical protein A3D66_01600 [Candidatus Kaiserbacteria bacterium RIFCSPHIGHO2_02_FULL_50_9]OGG71619.1 MAG: hypothetical protein A3A35_00380 [Candidatus Kaiserbacteria bacterium RIFCSPLOWO2_01_FULL_51_21]
MSKKTRKDWKKEHRQSEQQNLSLSPFKYTLIGETPSHDLLRVEGVVKKEESVRVVCYHLRDKRELRRIGVLHVETDAQAFTLAGIRTNGSGRKVSAVPPVVQREQ